MTFFEFVSSKYHGERGGEGGRVIWEHESPKKSLRLSLPGSYQNLTRYWSQIQCISVDPGLCVGPIVPNHIVPNPKTPQGNGFLKVCAEFQT
jgi:hypothetical protein